MSKGGVPVPYIIAVVLGIVVIGVIGYWFFVSSGKFGGAISETGCQAKELQWCIKPGTDWDKFAPGCGGQPTDKDCEELIPTTGGGTEGGSVDCSQYTNQASCAAAGCTWFINACQ